MRRSFNSVVGACSLLALLAAGCSSPTRHVAGRLPVRPPESYVRISNDDSNIVALQIAVRKFVPTRRPGATIWLTGVAHLGDSNYFAAVQKHLDSQTVVLFEGVTEQPGAPGRRPPQPRAEPDRSSLQSAMAASLGLVFQLDAIDYQSPRFRHSDLSVKELREIFAEQPRVAEQEGGGQSFEGLLQAMQGDSWLNVLIQMGLRFVSASPKLQAISRLALIEALAQLQGDPVQLPGLPPSWKQLMEVLIERRNQKVMTDLKAQLRQVGRQGSISVFYGTGHMPDLEKRLGRELGYRPSEQVWLTSFSVDLARAGVSTSERTFIQNLVQRELAELQKP